MQKAATVIFLLLFISGNIFSQESTSVSGEAVANLIYPLSLKAGSGDLDFGEIILTGLPIVERIKPKAGKEFIINGQKGRSVTIIYNRVRLNNYRWAFNFNGRLGRLRFFPEVISGNNNRIRSGDSIILEPNGNIGEARLYVGGRIRIRANQPIGDYQGLFIISVAY